MNGLRLKLKNFRAIADADIELADLTVLSGVNASGKSTIARLFHNFVELNRNYSLWCGRYSFFSTFISSFSAILALMEDLGVSTDKVRQHITDLANINLIPFNQQVEPIREELNRCVRGMRERKGTEDRRVWEAFQRALSHLVEVCSVDEFEEWLNKLFDEYEQKYAMYEKRLDNARLFVFMNDLKEFKFTSETVDNKPLLQILEGDKCLFDSLKLDSPLLTIYSPKRALYVENPSTSLPKLKDGGMLLGSNIYDLRDIAMDLLGENKNLFSDARFGGYSFLGGDFQAPQNQSTVSGGEWIYKRLDGRNFQLKECAEGIKSLATVQILERYGLLDSNALLIIDEPEVHLHPQWVVECAKILVDLVKEKRVRVLVTSHNPYLVQAFQQFARKKLCDGQCCFYMAEQEGNFTYSYKRLGMNIAPIFRTFNVALDQVAEISE